MVINNKSTAWNPILLLTLNFLSVFLLISWLYPTTRVWWDFIDFSIFMSLITIGFYFGTPIQSSVPLWAEKKLEKHFPAIDSFINRMVGR
jgi:hypothetical protein